MSRLYTGREAVDWFVLNGSGLVAGGISIGTPEGQTQLHSQVIEVFHRRFELSKRDVSYPRAKQADRFPKQSGAWYCSLSHGSCSGRHCTFSTSSTSVLFMRLRQPRGFKREATQPTCRPQFHHCYEMGPLFLTSILIQLASLIQLERLTSLVLFAGIEEYSQRKSHIGCTTKYDLRCMIFSSLYG